MMWAIVFVGPSVFIGLASVLALFSRTRLSQALGGLSIFLLAFAGTVMPIQAVGTWFRLCLYATPGLLGIVANRAVWRKRPPPGHCVQCGYNLTGNTSGVCPECGTPLGPS